MLFVIIFSALLSFPNRLQVDYSNHCNKMVTHLSNEQLNLADLVRIGAFRMTCDNISSYLLDISYQILLCLSLRRQLYYSRSVNRIYAHMDIYTYIFHSTDSLFLSRSDSLLNSFSSYSLTHLRTTSDISFQTTANMGELTA